jgi:signal transduction histidine kinase
VNTLRVKIALLLVAAIVSVVGLLTVVLFILAGPPPRAGRAIESVAEQVELLLKLTSHGTGDLSLASERAPGRVREQLTQDLRARLAEQGQDLPVVVSRKDWKEHLMVSIPIDNRGWLLMPVSDMPPPGVPWRGLIKWLAVITFGATAIAVFVANRMVRPLVLLESAVESVGPDAMLPELPERGPAEVRATARALNTLSARLKRAMESRMRLVAAAGHDLRTPITRMRLRAEFVADEEERGKWLDDLNELEWIADSAILLVREETGHVSPEVIRLDDLVAEIAAELREQQLDVSETVAQPVSVRASKLKLARALRNLMINAATHGLHARVKVDASSDETARIVIEDDGPGIPPALLDQVFEPFFRADRARSQDVPGAGLGLTIAREIVQRAGGTITIANRPGGGLIQTVELPRAEEVTQQVA